MSRFLLVVGLTLCVTAGAFSAAERLEILGNMKVLGDGNGVIFPDGTKLTRAVSNGTNTFVGVDAFKSATTGYLNTAAGWGALGANTTGHHNTAVGGGALAGNTVGFENTVVGNLAMNVGVGGTENTAIGVRALQFNFDGYGNAAVGLEALMSANSRLNTAIGARALRNYQGENGMRTVAIGYEAGLNLINGTNNVYIANAGTGQESDTIRIGRNAVDGDNHTRAFLAGVRGKTTGSSNTVTVLIDSNGQLGTIASSRRYKEDIQAMGTASSRVMALRPVTFRYRQAYADGSKPLDYGLIAEEVATVFPDLVVSGADGQAETVQYHKLTPLLLNEVQRQHRRVVELEAQMAALLKRLRTLEANRD